MVKMKLQATILERMERAVEKVRERLTRVCAALEGARVPFAVIGGNAVAAWVATVDETAVRNTRDVDLLIERSDMARARRALEGAGLVYRHVAGVDMFLDGPDASAREAVHIVFGGEKVRPDYADCAPHAVDSQLLEPNLRVLSLQALIRMKLTSFRRKDQMHLLDLIDVGLLGEEDVPSFPPLLAARLRELLENPEE